MRYFIAFCFVFLIAEMAFSQKQYTFGEDMEVYWDDKKLIMPFAGGLNAAHIQSMDLDSNGEEELVIWDVNSGNIKIFQLRDNEYFHLPNWSYYFPTDIMGFLILADYDGDGKKDLFTGSPFGIKAYKNVSQKGTLAWEEAQNFLRLEDGSNLTANLLDIPVIQDLDGDGDLDILTFNFASGDYLEYYQNTSIERKGERDIDGFASAMVRWGGFEFCGCSLINFGFTCSGQPINEAENNENLRIMHSGGHSLLYKDFTGNGVNDLLIGQDECETLYFLENKGTNEQPVFNGFSTSLPGYGKLPQFPVFHTAYPLKEEMVISSHSSENSINTGIDFSQSLYLISSNEAASLVTRSFLQEEMLDFGENARPYFEGNRLGGNLIVTANTTSDGEVVGKGFLFSLRDNEMRLESKDYLNLSRLKLTELSYQAFRAVSGELYHIVTGDEYINNVPLKTIFVASAEDPEKLEPVPFPMFTLRGLDQVHFFQDGQGDYLLLARQTGELVLFAVDLNLGFKLELLERNFLGFADNPVSRGLSVAVMSGEVPELMAINQRGKLMHATDFFSTGEMLPVALKTSDTLFPETRFGRNSWISFVPDIFGESTDLLIGTRAGGIEYLKQIKGSTTGEIDNLQASVYPNPAEDGRVKVVVNRNSSLRIVHSSGKLVVDNLPLIGNKENEILLLGLAPGLYILEINDEQQIRIFKKLIIKN